MPQKILSTALTVFALVVAGCGKRESAGGGSPGELVKETERSRHFSAVNRQLELGGTIYAYVDVDGDARKLAESLSGLLENIAVARPEAAPFVKQDYAALFTKLGFDDIKAFGLSSVPDGTGFFRNRAFFYTPEGRHGLLAGLGGKPGPFAHLTLAPENADVYSESEIDVPAIYLTIKDVIGQVGGETARNKFEESLQKAGEAAMISWLKLINATKGHVVFVFRFDPGKTFAIPGGTVLPRFSFLLRIDGVAAGVEDALREAKQLLTASQAGEMRLYELSKPLPIEGLNPVVAVEGSTLFFATTTDFLNECRAQKTNLGQDAEFKKALAQVGTEGNGIGFVSPRFFRRLREIESLNPKMPAELKSAVEYFSAHLPNPDRPLVNLRVNRPDGILVRSYWNRSLKQDVAMMTMYSPVAVGVVAAMGVPAFQKMRGGSQDKAVLANLRQFSAAADQFYIEHGVTRATYDDLVGPDKYIRRVVPVMGEDYRSMRFRSGEPLRVQLRDGRTIEYAP